MKNTLLTTARLHLCVLQLEDAPGVAALHWENAEHLAPWDPPRPEGWDSLEWWRASLGARVVMQREGRLLSFLLRRRADARLVGMATLSDVDRGVFQNAHLGYKLDAGAVGEGLMTEALATLLDFAFGPMGLHRVEANVLPENTRSGALLDRLGFETHGLAKAYLRIGLDGRFRDHLLRSTRAELWAGHPLSPSAGGDAEGSRLDSQAPLG